MTSGPSAYPVVFLILISLAFLAAGCTQPDFLQPSNDSTVSPADLPPQPSELQRVLTFAKPAVVLIKTDISGSVVLPEAEIDPYTGVLRPLASTYSESYESFALGSGFIVSPDGYVITNAHVVKTDADLENTLLAAATNAELQSAVQSYTESYGTAPSQNDLDTLQQVISDYVSQYGRVESPRRRVTIIMGANIPGVSLPPTEHTANVRRIGSSEIGAVDIALLKIEQTNLPTVQLGNSDEMDAAAPVYAIGYPGIVTQATGEEGVFSLGSVTEPTLTAGVISSRRTTNAGITVLGIDASIKPGNSGGPAFNERGEVIGITTFGFNQDETYNFIVPSNLVRDFLREANVENRPGAVDEHYRRGLEHYWAGDYAEAQAEFEIVRNLYPGHPYLGQYLSLVQERQLASTN